MAIKEVPPPKGLTIAVAGAEHLKGGYSQEQLEKAFNQVKNPKNWKERIRIRMTGLARADIALITEAIIHFTGSVPNFKPDEGVSGSYLITAAGYYSAIGA